MAVGYSLTGHTFEEIMFYLYGPPRSGKGTFTETINALMGDLSAGVGFSTFTSERQGDNNNFDLAPLRFKRFVTASESTRHHMLDAATIKKVTGGDSVYCAFKHQTHFSYRPQYKIWLTSNWPVNADVDDDAAWGRLRIIPFAHSFLETEDKGLKHRMKSEEMLTAVLAWAVAGAIKWYSLGDKGLPVLDELRAQSQAQRDENDTVGQFISAQCVTRESEISPTAVLYLHYSTWCADEGYKPRSRKGFVQAMATRGISSTVARYKGTLTRVLVGIVYQNDMPV
jgi:putative DNA primase/helicase